MRSSSVSPELSNRHSSTFVALAENSAKFTPSPSQVAPSGKGRPSDTRDLFLLTDTGISRTWQIWRETVQAPAPPQSCTPVRLIERLHGDTRDRLHAPGSLRRF